MKEKLSHREVLATAEAMAVGIAAERVVGGGVSIAGAKGGNTEGRFPPADSSQVKRKNMIISTIVENCLFNDDLKCRHGFESRRQVGLQACFSWRGGLKKCCTARDSNEKKRNSDVKCAL